MTILHRRLIYAGFIALFLITAPLITLYTMGYRYNFSKGRVQKTGILRITSIPRGADILLNNVKYIGSQTPAKIEKLLPGDYEIKLSKDGYHDWSKKLSVLENGTTFAEKTMLWKKSDPEALNAAHPAAWLESPDGNTVALAFASGTVSLLNVNSGLFGEISGGTIAPIAELAGFDNTNLKSFSPSGRYLLAQADKAGKASYFLIDTVEKNSRKLPDQNLINIKWDASQDDLFALDASGLWNIGLRDLKRQAAVEGLAADDFYLSGKTLHFIATSTLYRQTIGSGPASAVEKINCNKCRIQEIVGNRLIATGNSNELLIIDLNRRIKTIAATAKGSDWLDSRSLIFYNDYEIFIYELAKSDPELITRLGSPISAAIWHPGRRHLIFSSDKKIKIIELDNREYRNITEIADGQADELLIDRAGQNAYFTLDKAGVFKLNIQ